MINAFRISFSLKNTYRVNAILHALKQIPLLKKLLPQTLYRARGLKIFANVLAGIWEILSIFLGKIIYFITMVTGIAALYTGVPADGTFLHILLFLTVIGGFMNTNMFNPTRDKYYAMFLMRMDARAYALVNYGYAIAKVLVGFIPVAIFFGASCGVPLWICLLIPGFVVGLKLTVTAWSLWDYDRRGLAYNENKLGKWLWLSVGLLLAAAYGLPAMGIVLPVPFCAGCMVLFVVTGICGIPQIYRFSHYREIYQQLLGQMFTQMDNAGQILQKQSQRTISADTSITSRKQGFEYLNELFIKRHQKILWKAAIHVTVISLFLITGVLLAFYLRPDFRAETNAELPGLLPYFVFILYGINRGTGFTRALFMNCDHSLLTYSVFKQPNMIVKLFAIRLREIIKINLLPALVIGGGLAGLLYASGGTDQPLDYVVLPASVCCMSIFFSVHYLTIYYLLQPYTAGTEMKSAVYQIVLSLTYVACYGVMQVKIPLLAFGALCGGFCVLYCAAACLLVYRLAPKTFRLRT